MLVRWRVAQVVMCYAEKGDIEKLVQISGTQPGYQPDYMFLLQSLMGTNPEGAVALAKKIAKVRLPRSHSSSKQVLTVFRS
jgi:hypothetical protein